MTLPTADRMVVQPNEAMHFSRMQILILLRLGHRAVDQGVIGESDEERQPDRFGDSMQSLYSLRAVVARPRYAEHLMLALHEMTGDHDYWTTNY
uniref:Uncharacterized protein n=1 Tax=Pristionchus pacificus TaxID=54126 RepID=A0A2A6B6U0_PRIPA|eukprot:PDM61586.1 hypothetical protein PRIPAC_51028 [Pristionchus pacificus]